MAYGGKSKSEPEEEWGERGPTPEMIYHRRWVEERERAEQLRVAADVLSQLMKMLSERGELDRLLLSVNFERSGSSKGALLEWWGKFEKEAEESWQWKLKQGEERRAAKLLAEEKRVLDVEQLVKNGSTRWWAEWFVRTRKEEIEQGDE